MGLTFDALGRMVEQARGSSYTQIIYSPSGYKLALMNGQNLQKAFCPLPGGATAVYGSSGTIAYYRHTDWLDSSRFASTPSRTKYFDVAYAPYGEDYADSGTTDLNFTGQNQDTVSGLYDFIYREYHPNSGRWIQPDPAGLGAANPANPQTWNRYTYVGNMPLNAVDPLGLKIAEGGDVFYHDQNSLAGLDEFDLAARGILPIGGEAGFCPAQFTGCVRANGGTLGVRFDGTLSQFIFGEVGENGDAISALEVSRIRLRLGACDGVSPADFNYNVKQDYRDESGKLVQQTARQHIISGHIFPGEAGNTLYAVHPAGPNYTNTVFQNVVMYNAATFLFGSKSVDSSGHLVFDLNFPVTVNPYNKLPAVIGIDLYTYPVTPLTHNRLVLNKDCSTVRTSFPY